METITLYGVNQFEPDQMVVALRRWVRTETATFTTERGEDHVQVTIQAEAGHLHEATDRVLAFYASWRRASRPRPR